MSNSLWPYTVHGILQARIQEWVAVPFSRDLPSPGIELRPRSPTLQADSLPVELPGKPITDVAFAKNTKYYEKISDKPNA